MLWKALEKIFKILSSLELAVITLLTLAVVLIAGTIYEAKYGAAVASQEVYRSIWMQGLLWVLLANVAAVAVSRWPWKKHHVGFLITHLGIIVLLIGSFLTQRWGIDGSLLFSPGESARSVKIDENMLNVFRAVEGSSYDLMLSERLDLSLLRPLKSPREWKLQDPSGKGSKLRVVEFLPKAVRSVKAVDRPKGKGVPAFRYALRGSRAQFEDWIFLQTDKASTREIGPARVRFSHTKPLETVPEKPTLYVYTDGKEGLPFLAVGHPKEKKLRYLGRAELKKAKALGWMDFNFVIDEFHPSAIPSVDYRKSESARDDARQVIAVELGGEKIWVELGAAGQIALGDALYYIQYAPKQIDLGFELQLEEFRVGYYEGTNRAKSYESVVKVGPETHVISMNEPMKQKGFTFYQASFETDDAGKPTASILSVNYDPGRSIKYLGSLMIVLGTLSMFYFKPKYSGTNRWLLGNKQQDEAKA